ncbi:MAG TPA: RDD family protein [Thermoanaerobaculia bacterium]|nr:RDD family protein [Thermoanaerobaculia bacterium]
MICRNHVDVSEGVRRCARCGGTYCSNCLVTIADQPYCATCKSERVLDARSGVYQQGLRLSGFWQRAGAYMLDYLIQLVAMYALFIPLGIIGAMTAKGGDPSMWFLLIYPIGFAVVIAYEALMLSMKNGQTVGKMALRIRVVRPDGSPISKGQAWGRAVMRLVLGCLILVDYLVFFFTDERTTLHDITAKTRVVDVY